MRIIARKTLREFWAQYPDSRGALEAWYIDTKRSTWCSPTDIKAIYGNASILPNNRVVFNIKGNNYRLVVAINYEIGIVYIRFIGSHKAYDQIDATAI